MWSVTAASLQSAASMFVVLALELSMLFVLISFAVAVIQHKLPAGKVQALLSAKKGSGYLTAAAIGAITPFCSCSTIPMLSGLLRAGAGFGPTMTFLFVSPLLNPIVVGLLWMTFGWKVTLIYTVATLVITLLAGFLMERLNFGRYVKQTAPKAKSCCGAKPTPPAIPWKRLWQDALKQFRVVSPYLLLGVAIGAFTYGFIPAEWIASHTGSNNPLAIPVAAVVGIPLYLRAETLIPMASMFALKGMGLGALMALIIGGAGASLTELILLKALFRRQILIAFLVVIIGTAISAGYLFTALTPWLAI